MKKIIRVFPRRTRATPDDDLVRINEGPGLFDEADEVHISVTFTWDLPRAEELYNQWKHVTETKIGGPATGERGENFIAGRYLKNGYTITSRGCPNRCWFCSVWKREGDHVRELNVESGWNLLDDNILAASSSHILRVFNMLVDARRQFKHGVEFTGGLEAKRLTPQYAGWLKAVRPSQMFLAYDTEDDLKPLQDAGQFLQDAGFTLAPKSHTLRCYVLCGYPKDTREDAEKRMFQTIDAGFFPMAMLWRDKDGKYDLTWKRWQRKWARPAIISERVKQDRMSA